MWIQAPITSHSTLRRIEGAKVKKNHLLLLQDNETNKNLMACWKDNSKQLKGFFEGFGFVFDSKEVPSTEKLTTEVNDLVKKNLSEFRRKKHLRLRFVTC
jgi:hypothetical protein